MAVNITDSYLPLSVLHRPGIAINPTKIAVHYTGSPMGKAINVRNYFATTSNYVSSNYIVGLEGEILRLIPENEMSYCTNQANSYAISIETCHPDATGKFTTITYNALVALCADICKRRKFNPINDIIRHYDVTGKCCPYWWSPNGPNKNANADFLAFKQDVKKAMEPPKPAPKKVVTSKITTYNDAVSLLVKNKIIASPDFWYNAQKTINYIEPFMINAANNIYNTKMNNITDINKALAKIKEKGVVTTTEYWANACTTNKYLANLIINISCYL